MTSALKPRCCARVWVMGGYTHHPCGAISKVERGGKHYCGRHDPVAKQAKRDAQAAAWSAAYEARRAEEDRAAEAEAELKRRASHFDALLAALDAALALCASVAEQQAMSDDSWRPEAAQLRAVADQARPV